VKGKATDYLAQFQATGALLDGHFLLSSGLHSPRYLQCALVLQYPKIAEAMCADLAERVRQLEPQVVLAPALGGIVLAYELARALGVRGIFGERKEGKMVLRRGFRLTPGERVLLAEDVITTGGSLRELYPLVEAAGAQVVCIAALVDRSSEEKRPDFGATLESLICLSVPTYAPEVCPLCKKGLPLVKPGSRETLGGGKAK